LLNLLKSIPLDIHQDVRGGRFWEAFQVNLGEIPYNNIKQMKLGRYVNKLINKTLNLIQVFHLHQYLQAFLEEPNHFFLPDFPVLLVDHFLVERLSSYPLILYP